MGEFKGFSKSFFSFFKELSKNNNKAWFTDNKSRYEHDVVTPLLAFISDMGPRLKKISPHFIASPRKSGGSMFRIYRDVRFSKDKRPYKENAGCHFRHENGKDAHAPGFYVHLEPGKIFFGGGIWAPQGEALKSIRTAIAEDAKGWSKIIKNRKFNETFGDIRGDRLTRPPKGFSADIEHIEDIKRKSFFAMHEGHMKMTQGPEFLDEVTKTLKASVPLMRFLCNALKQPF